MSASLVGSEMCIRDRCPKSGACDHGHLEEGALRALELRDVLAPPAPASMHGVDGAALKHLKNCTPAVSRLAGGDGE
eukprot:12857284-Alexandrium_andersonii.AAC.1